MSAPYNSSWKWLGHKQHLIVARRCQFSLATQIGDVVVSTVGEWDPEEAVRKIVGLKEDEFEEIGAGRKYETMICRTNGSHECGCPNTDGDEWQMEGAYNTAAAAQAGHLAICHKVAAGELPEVRS